MAEISNKIALLFWEELPSHQAGKCIEFIATSKKYVWRGGRDPKRCDPDLCFESKPGQPGLISRVHFTLYCRQNHWFIIDGGIYAGEEIPRPSTNGVRVKLTTKWERIGTQTELEHGTLIWLGPGYRIVVTTDCSNITLGNFYWLDYNWPVTRPKPEEASVAPGVEKPDVGTELADHANVTGWAILLDVVNWYQEKPASTLDLIHKIVMLAAIVQLAAIAAAVFYLWRQPDHSPKESSRVQVEVVRDTR